MMGIECWDVGGAEVARIQEQIGPMFDPRTFFPDYDAAVLAQVRRLLGDAHVAESGRIVSSIHSWLIRIDGRNVLVDGCIGDHKDRHPYRRWHELESDWSLRLAAVGVTPADIDYVMCTHLHVDHVGWNTRKEDGRWVPTFPNARYLFSRKEVEHFHAERDAAATDEFDAVSKRVWDDSVLPVLDAGLVDFVDGVHPVLADRLVMEPSPGHTPGSCSLVLRDDVERACFTGDMVHHPVQVYRPDWNSSFCELPEQARRTRRAWLERCADSSALLMTAHFGAPFATRVRRVGDAFDLDFVEPDRILPLP